MISDIKSLTQLVLLRRFAAKKKIYRQTSKLWERPLMSSIQCRKNCFIMWGISGQIAYTSREMQAFWAPTMQIWLQWTHQCREIDSSFCPQIGIMRAERYNKSQFKGRMTLKSSKGSRIKLLAHYLRQAWILILAKTSLSLFVIVRQTIWTLIKWRIQIYHNKMKLMIHLSKSMTSFETQQKGSQKG